jgi:predicted phage baseplate assembly protein
MSICVCTPVAHPPPLSIPAGLTQIPRQVAGFAEFRQAMLAAVRRFPALNRWRARGEDDFGIMHLEMWAYVAHVQAFYDETIAHEAYLRTARRRPSLRRLVGLLGYLPQPAVAASVTLAALAQGRRSILVPQGLAFRSAAFDGQAPQVFELDAPTTIHPFFNQWPLAAPVPKTLGGTERSATQTFGQLLLTPASALKKDDGVLVRVGGSEAHTQLSTVTQVTDIVAQDGRKYKQADFSPALTLPENTVPAELQLSKATQTGSLWKIKLPVNWTPRNGADPWSSTQRSRSRTAQPNFTDANVFGSGIHNPATIDDNQIILDGLYRTITAGQYLILDKLGERRWYRVEENQEVMMTVSPATTTTVTDAEGNDVPLAVPPVTTWATRLVLDTAVNDTSRTGGQSDWDDDDATVITLHHGLVSGAAVTVAAPDTLSSSDELAVASRIETPADGTQTPTAFLVQDQDEQGYAVDASLNADTGLLTLGQNAGWTTPMKLPVTLYGNLTQASRGETVAGEVLGSGDASQANQRFVLKKSPLTYTASPTADNEQGLAASLKVYVDGILWQEVPSFYGVGPLDQVYIVRHDDEEAATVIFGDGQRGAHLPSGSNNVTATYRFGAGKPAPSAGGITQLAKPFKGLTGIKSPLAAFGGDDAETSATMRQYAPASALLLGRAVSLPDMQALAAGVPGVRATTVDWRWNQTQQRPVVQVWYIGDAAIAGDVGQALRRLCDPTTPIAADVALPQPLTLSLDITIDARYLEDDVLPRIRAALMDSATGLLAPERIGIGRPLFRSRVFEAVLAVAGATAVSGLLVESDGKQSPWSAYALQPAAGTYFDVEQGGLLLNGRESDG